MLPLSRIPLYAFLSLISSCFFTLQARKNTFEDQVVAVPAVLLEYNRDAIFSYTLLMQLARGSEKIAMEESSWILGSSQQDIELMIENARSYQEELLNDGITPNEHEALILRNCDQLAHALKQTQAIMSRKEISLPRSYVIQQLWSLRFEVANFKTLKAIDNSQELKLHNPRLYTLLDAAPSIDELHTTIKREFEKLSTLKGIA